MTGKERVVAALRGGPVGAKPVAVWSESPGHACDAAIVSHLSVEDAVRTHPDQAVLAEVVSPFGVALRRGSIILERLRDEPQAGAQELAALADEVRKVIRQALDEGADGIFYRLDGAYGAAATPMEYGGHFLEVDRSILAEIEEPRIIVVNVEGEADVYYDCVADLPGHGFAWDIPHTGITIEAMRSIRKGPLVAHDKDADVILLRHIDDLESL